MNKLSLLPLAIQVETQKVLKKTIQANCALVKLNGVAIQKESEQNDAEKDK